jgi:hypothetical protein
MTRRTARYARFKACEGKRRYFGKREAWKAAHSALNRTGKQHRAYRCDFGNHWHITHLSKALFDYYNGRKTT